MIQNVVITVLVLFGLEISIPRLGLLLRATMAVMAGVARPVLGVASGLSS